MEEMSPLQSERSCSFDEFTSMIHKLLKAAWGDNWGIFTESFPNGMDAQHVKFPIITYSLLSKRPGSVNKEREIKPRVRSIETLPNGDSIAVYGQRYDHMVLFEVWAATNTQAAALAEKFEDFMFTYTGYFMQNGVRQILFQEMNNGSVSANWLDTVVCRHFKYYVQLEKHITVQSSVIKEVTGRVSVAEDINDALPPDQYIDFTTQRRNT